MALLRVPCKLIAGDDEFDVEALEGQGSEAEVYRTLWNKRPGHFALRIPRSVDEWEFFSARVAAWVQITAPEVVRGLHFGMLSGVWSPERHIAEPDDIGNSPFLLMEYIPNLMTLGKYLKRHEAKGPLPLETVLRLLADICTSARCIHETPFHSKDPPATPGASESERGPGHLIHRDLKPENIAVLPDGRARIMDPGSVRLVGAPSLSAPLWPIGTFEYMAPEAMPDYDPRVPEMARKPRQETIARDLFSIGVIAYRLLSGRMPVDHRDQINEVVNDLALRALIPTWYRDRKYISLARRFNDQERSLHPRLIAWVERAMEPAPEDRFPTAQAMLDALQPFLGWDGRVRVIPAGVADLDGLLATLLELAREHPDGVVLRFGAGVHELRRPLILPPGVDLEGPPDGQGQAVLRVLGTEGASAIMIG